MRWGCGSKKIYTLPVSSLAHRLNNASLQDFLQEITAVAMKISDELSYSKE